MCSHAYYYCRQFAATDLKIMRIAMASFFDMAILTARTLLEFDSSI
jgi:hypothetical protein